MTPELRVVDKEDYRVEGSHAVGEDVQHVHDLFEVQLFVAVAKVLQKPHDVMREQEDGERDDVSEHHARDTIMAVTAAGSLGIKDSETGIRFKEIFKREFYNNCQNSRALIGSQLVYKTSGVTRARFLNGK